ncbi:MAG: hypothetical protein J6V65_05395 [Fibrobacterales bacterium]|nr:hypothetical protein [Fibrobacterales bacterium]
MKPILVPALLSSLCLAALVACDDGGSSSGPEGDSSEALSSETSSAGSSSSAPKKLTVETYDDLPSCNLVREGAKAFVKDEGVSYVCDAGFWTEIPDGKSSSGNSDGKSSKKNSSSSSRPGSSSSGGSAEQTYAFGYALKNAPRPSAGCGKTVALGDRFQFTGGGVEHEVYLDLPANYDRNKPYRLVFGFHDIDSTAESVSRNLNYYGLRLKDSVNTIFVAPHGYTVETDKSGHETSNPWRCGDDKDHLFFAELLTYLNENLCIDTSRVFAVGFSFGAMMANSLAQDFQDRLRGVAVFATMDQVIYLPKNKGLPIAWMGTVGMGDDLTTPKLGRSARDRILKNNGRPDENGNFTDARSETAAEWTGGNHVCHDYESVDERFPVKWCTFDGGHTYNPKEDGAAWTAATAWEFIAQF